MKRLYVMLLFVMMIVSFSLHETPHASAQTPERSALSRDDAYSNGVIETQFQLAQKCRRDLGLPAFQTRRAWETAVGQDYRRWIYQLWRKRYVKCEKQTDRAYSDVRFAIRLIFRGLGDPRYAYDAKEQAVRVAWCESRWSPQDRLGQYVGLFQMGNNERADYGIGLYASRDEETARYATIIDQVRSAYRMFVAAGRSWTRWACRPGSGGETSSHVAY